MIHSLANIAVSATLAELLTGCTLSENTVGHSGSGVYRVDPFMGRPAYLKIAPSGWAMTLRPEKEALDWLRGRFPVPEVLYEETYRERDFLVVSELEGRDGSHESLLAKPEAFVRLYAEALNRLHRIGIAACPLDRRLAVKLGQAERRVREGLVDAADLEENNQGRSPADMLDELRARRPASEDLVFTHGDYCLPNIVVDGNRLSGFIDLGRAGIADRYQDLALAIRSLRHNFGSDAYKDVFLAHYGIDRVDEDKLMYYTLLDELF